MMFSGSKRLSGSWAAGAMRARLAAKKKPLNLGRRCHSDFSTSLTEGSRGEESAQGGEEGADPLLS
jgi:hypothetical protein